MVKLLRLVSNNETKADFSNFFNEAIEIKPDGKIALDSLKIECDNRIIVNDGNNTFQFSTSTKNPVYTCTLTNGEYTAQEFVAMLSARLARSMTYTFYPRNPNLEQNYTEYKPILTDEGKLNIQWVTNLPDTGHLCNWYRGFITAGYITETLQPIQDLYYLGDSYRRTNTVWLGQGAPYIYTQKPLVNGPAEFIFTIDYKTTGDPDNTFDGVAMALRVSNEPFTNNIDYVNSPFSIVSGFDVDGVTGLLSVQVDGVAYGSATISPAIMGLDDVQISLRMTLQDGRVRFFYSIFIAPYAWIEITRSNANIAFPTYTSATNYLGYIFLEEAGNQVYNISYTSTPYANLNTSGYSIVSLNSEIQDLELNHRYNEFGQPSQVATIHTLVLPEGARKLMGFFLAQYTQNSIASQFIADVIPDSNFYTGPILVELPTEFVDSFDGKQNRRRNIIKYIPSDKTQTQTTRNYSSLYPTYIDIGNKEKRVLNYFQIRLLDEDYKPLVIAGTSGSDLEMKVS